MQNNSELTPLETADLRKFAVQVSVGLQPQTYASLGTGNQEPKTKSADKILADAEKIYSFISK